MLMALPGRDDDQGHLSKPNDFRVIRWGTKDVDTDGNDTSTSSNINTNLPDLPEQDRDLHTWLTPSNINNTPATTSSSIAGKDSDKLRLETANVLPPHPSAPSSSFPPSNTTSTPTPKLQRRQSLRFPIKTPGSTSESPTKVALSESSASVATTAATTSSAKSNSAVSSKKDNISPPPPPTNHPPSRSSSISKPQQQQPQPPKPQARSQPPVSTPVPIKRLSLSRTVSEFSIPSPPDDEEGSYPHQYQSSHPLSSSPKSSVRSSPPNSFFAKRLTPPTPEEKSSVNRSTPPPPYVFDPPPAPEPKDLSQQSRAAAADTPRSIPSTTTKAPSPTPLQPTIDNMSSPVKNAEQQAEYAGGQQQRGVTLGLAPPMPGLSGDANTATGNLLKGPVGPDGRLRDASLMVGIKLDLEAEVHLTARVRGDILVGLY